MTARSVPLPARRMLSTDEAAEYCGGKSVDWLKAHVKVAPVKLGSLVRYDVRALDKWLDSLDQSTPLTGDDWLGLLDEGDGEGR
ncbi:helix-turn-helix domain-containing protein [Mesorhizobium sp. ESP7-2]|uniref:helix-turn-helix domain-containing protein n=1 Tax=Mesorhizobium sp. ESP7-2 TaxID=2876622 RepID=UPI001CCF2109|nr:helix-turn-helix domain-containing protein [Mesorhizobium sp. ESP7-2]MBZ9705368.1 helix-turn-helix domain-containing protein [Mesorhizobium sp. ESP7-2]